MKSKGLITAKKEMWYKKTATGCKQYQKEENL